MVLLLLLALISLCLLVLSLLLWKEGVLVSNKTGATLSAVLLGLLSCFFFGTNAPACGGIFLVAALLCGLFAFFSWYIPFSHGQKLIAENKAVRELPVQREAIAPPMEHTPGVSKLFVAEPLERNK